MVTEAEKADTPNIAIAAFIFSLLFFIPFFSVIGFVVGIIALRKLSRANQQKGKGFAVAAVAIGAIVTVGYILLIMVYVSLFSVVSGLMGSALSEESLAASIAGCAAKTGIGKDTCITFALATHPDDADQLGQGFCDSNVADRDLNSFCNAIASRDARHCDRMQGPSKQKCLTLVEDLQNKGTVGEQRPEE